MKSAFCIFSLLLFFASAARAETVGDRCKESGDHALCGAAGASLEPSSPDTAMDLYSAECSKHPNDCFSIVAYGQRLLLKKNPTRADQVWSRGCELRAWRACAALAAELEEGERGIPQDVTRAAKYHNAACEFGSGRDCVLLAVMTEDGRGVRRDPRAAARLRARADQADHVTPRPAPPAALLAADDALCRNNQDAAHCLAAGRALEDTDAVKAEELYRLGCTFDKSTCGLWAFALERLRRDDPARGTRVLDEGCTAGAGLACLLLADLNHTGYRPPALVRNETHAAELYERACTAGEPGGCRVIAARYRGVRDIAKADELRARAASLEAEVDKPLSALQEAWLKDAGQARAAPYEQELDRKRGDWRVAEARARARWELRLQRLAEVEAGRELTPLPAEAGDASDREAAIRRMAKLLFPQN